jgi:hypothetical protein
VYREQSSQAKFDSHNDSKYSQRSVENQGGESQKKVTSSCTQVCGDKESTSKSCAKILPLYVYLKGKPEIPQKVYALIDEQSTHTLATPILFDRLEENAEQIRFVLSSCSGKTSMIGRKSSHYIIESLDHSVCIDVPSIIECSDIPNNREEIPSPEVVANHPHLKDLTSHILPIDLNTNIEILIGRDVISAPHVLDQRLGGECALSTKATAWMGSYW